MSYMKFAVIQTGGKQYKVSKDDVVSIEKMKGEYKVGDKVVLIKFYLWMMAKIPLLVLHILKVL